MKKIGLKTDFYQYYDLEFYPASQADVFIERFAGRRDMPKSLQIEILRQAGFYTPKFGTVQELMYQDVVDFVEYIDEYLHNAEGKRVSNHKDFVSTKNLAMEVMGPPGYSIRKLFVGDTVYVISYKSDSFFSNKGDPKIHLMYDEERSSEFMKDYPLFSIDFVKNGHDLDAVDFNTAPGIPKSIEIPKEEIYENISRWMNR